MKNRFRILLPLASFAAALTSLPAAAAGKEELVEIDTTLGNIVVRLAPDRAPITVKNFLTYVREGFYKDTIFHRVIPGFMIQGGGAALPSSFVRSPPMIPFRSKPAAA